MARHSCICPAIQPQRFASQPSYPAAPMTSAPGLPSSEEGSFTSKGGVSAAARQNTVLPWSN